MFAIQAMIVFVGMTLRLNSFAQSAVNGGASDGSAPSPRESSPSGDLVAAPVTVTEYAINFVLFLDDW